jgi:hypothetical protein
MWALAHSAPRIERLIGEIFQSRIVGFIVGFDLRLGGGVVRTCGGSVLSDPLGRGRTRRNAGSAVLCLGGYVPCRQCQTRD